MSKWATIAKTHFLHKAGEGTPKTPETRLMGVMGVVPRYLSKNEGGVMGVMGVPTQPLCKKQHIDSTAAIDPDQDRWCWPHSPAMNTKEIATFTNRQGRFARKGLSPEQEDLLLDRLKDRDRDGWDLNSCYECISFDGYLCKTPLNSELCIRLNTARVPDDIKLTVKYCAGFLKDDV